MALKLTKLTLLGTVHECRLCVEVPSISTKRVDCVLILFVGGGWGVTDRSNFKKCRIFLELHQIQSIVHTIYSIIHAVYNVILSPDCAAPHQVPDIPLLCTATLTLLLIQVLEILGKFVHKCRHGEIGG